MTKEQKLPKYLKLEYSIIKKKKKKKKKKKIINFF